ncbi:hypothetical protein ABMA27_013153 [Loxostege sticticalis]|uniref:PiggyBac transposable element-derived protein domain-containing protein n=1 Tax=Loxostege sticticalis TaxID=481309 RepID=A0ABR3IE94_LOXSC
MEPSTSSVRKRPFVNNNNNSAAKTRRVVVPGNKDFDSTVMSWIDCEDSSGSEAEEIDNSFTPELHEHEPDTCGESDLEEEDNVTQEQTSSDDDVPLASIRPLYGKNRYKWSRQPPSRAVRVPQHNIIRRTNLSNLTENQPKDPLSIWNNYIDNDILHEILKWTNEKFNLYRANFTDKDRPELKNLDMVELHAFIGLLLYTAVFKSNHENVDYIFATDGTGREIFRCGMSKNRFLFILHCLRFDNSADREERKLSDKIAAVSVIFTKFVKNCQKLYNVSECATVDEMLVPFRGRTHLMIYMPMKPAKYGLKFMCLCDAKNGYFYNCYIYTGRGSDGEGLTDEEKKFMVPTQSVIHLAKPLFGSNRNITCDNWFTSMELVDYLKKNGLTCVGTMKKNKREIPPEFLPSKRRVVGSTLYGFTGQNTILSHVPRQNKAVILLSSMHHAEAFDEATGKPEIIEFYNKTKGGVDEIDKKCSIYTSSRRTRRWPMVVFYRMLDISTVNSHVLYDIHNEKTTERGIFIKELARSLVLPHLKRRVMNERLPRELRLCLTRVLGKDMPVSEPPKVDEEGSKKRRRCHTCPLKVQRKSTHTCYLCKKHVCLQCSKEVCPDCM